MEFFALIIAGGWLALNAMIISTSGYAALLFFKVIPGAMGIWLLYTAATMGAL